MEKGRGASSFCIELQTHQPQILGISQLKTLRALYIQVLSECHPKKGSQQCHTLHEKKDILIKNKIKYHVIKIGHVKVPILNDNFLGNMSMYITKFYLLMVCQEEVVGCYYSACLIWTMLFYSLSNHTIYFQVVLLQMLL